MMNDHATQWIPAYHDGELSGSRREWVEAHLESCESCRKELEQLTRLSSLLIQAPVPAHSSAERFAASVKLRLPQASVHQKRNRALKLAWQLAPFAVVGGWALFQAAVITTGLGITFGLDRMLQTAVPAIEWSPGLSAGELFSGSLPVIDRSILAGIEPYVELFAVGLLATFLAGILLAGWFAGWWSYQRSHAQAENK
jgi:anti-sigma factor RsiW